MTDLGLKAIKAEIGREPDGWRGSPNIEPRALLALVAEVERLRAALRDVGAMSRGNVIESRLILREIHKRSYVALHPQEQSGE